MKKRSFIPIASLVVLSGAAAISGTFAWFQTVRTATVTFDDATIRSRDSNLRVELVHSDNVLGDNQETFITNVNKAAVEYGDIKLNISGEKQFVTDISGNGVNFYKLENGYRRNNNTKKADGISWHKPLSIETVTKADEHYIDFTLKLFREKLSADWSRDMAVYLGNGTKIEPVTTTADNNPTQLEKDEKAVAGARLSVVEVTEAYAPIAGKTHKIFTQVAEPTTVNLFKGYDAEGVAQYDNGIEWDKPLYHYLTATTGNAYGLTTHTLQPVGAGNEILEIPLLSSLAEQTTVLDTHNNYLGLLTEKEVEGVVKPTPIYLNFRMWLEGTDADVGIDNDNLAIGGKIKLTLDLYTLHVNP